MNLITVCFSVPVCGCLCVPLWVYVSVCERERECRCVCVHVCVELSNEKYIFGVWYVVSGVTQWRFCYGVKVTPPRFKPGDNLKRMTQLDS